MALLHHFWKPVSILLKDGIPELTEIFISRMVKMKQKNFLSIQPCVTVFKHTLECQHTYNLQIQ